MPPDVADALARIESQTFIPYIDWFDELGSTNDYALSISADPELPTPRLIWTDRQTAGRGRSGHAWWSARGSLTFSLLLDRDVSQLPPEVWPQISLVTGLAIAEALAEEVPGRSVGVKWPNDIQIDGLKVCGILMEPSPRHSGRLVVGVGINVLNSFRNAPAELRAIATALCDQQTHASEPVAVLLHVLQRWSEFVGRLQQGQLHLPSEWQRRCVLTNRRLRVTMGTAILEGYCRGIDESGALLVETPQGLVRQVAGTVRLIGA